MKVSKRRLRPIEIVMFVVPLCALAFASWRMWNRPEPPPPFVPPHYTITDLGPTNTRSWITDINDKSEVVGAWGTSNKTWRPVVWRNGKMSFISTHTGIANGINNAGEIVGQITMPNRKGFAFLWRNGKLLNLGTLGGPESSASDINNLGLVVGYSDTKLKRTAGQAISHACTWKNGKMTDIGPFNSVYSQAFAINDKNEIVGRDMARAALLWREGLNLPIELGHSVDARAINNAGTVLGQGQGDATGMGISIWRNGRIQRLQFDKYTKPFFFNP